MQVLFTARVGAAERSQWLQALRDAAPECTWWTDEDGDMPREAIAAAVVANPAPGALAGLLQLRLVQSLWAGVEKLLADATLPPDVPLARMVDPAMSVAMAETALWIVLSLHRGFFDYAAQQARTLWLQKLQLRAEEVRILVLGKGQMGGAVEQRLSTTGYRVSTWRASDAVPLSPMLAATDIVINLLPLTPMTRGLLDARFFAALPRLASIVNLGRGGHVVEHDLLAALDGGQLNRAVLDVFATEPLPAEHPFWHHPQVTVLPHIAALTDVRSAAHAVARNLRALREGAPLAHLVDRARGY